ncbi:hypothetical protein TcasGA2_TC034103 [Tribolium castaneum]|uniref:Uncharacterized protein n=1 Tax=Tribolium castaneum TaxID=7070 RepID=A0A139WDC4_TRICA|nr:PREDICTED: uncharacterized protein LOC107398506 [Tribolium castaneum]KYB25914.1 hypothetical protein TcasGA2_TC034103 [Tribolium castaneum]|eukprot:XP_015838275.1 PREDICTED: uncharacterized protein LOC107398506 [Tribolium castaneum]
MTSPKFIYVSLIMLPLIFGTVHSIRCYNCSSHSDPACADIKPSENSTLLQECSQPDAFCRKTLQTIVSESLTIITRGCGWIEFDKHSDDHCHVSNTNFKKETSCQCFTDACNKADGFIAVDVLILSGIILALISLSGY